MKCEKSKPESEFYFRKKENRFRSWCKVCHKEYNAVYYVTHKERHQLANAAYCATHREQRRAYGAAYYATHKKQYRAYSIAWRKTHPEVKQAHNILNNTIETGCIVRPSVCSVCGCTNCVIHAHHPDYSKPLEVVWLCVSCHRKLHQQLKEETTK